MVPLTPIGAAIVSLAILAVLMVPRRWAPVPMLLVTCYMTASVGVMLGPFNFFSIRLLILAGLIRIVLRGEYRGFLRSPLDRVMVIWSVWALVASAFRSDPWATLIFNGGLVFNFFGVYLLLRSWCRDPDDVIFLCRIGAWLLVPIALEMVFEQLTSTNLFSMLGGVPEMSEIRQGRVRAQGPFAHSIMAGTVGGVMLPLCLGIWNRFPVTAMVGVFSCITMVIASASSGPLMTAMFGILGILFWSVRRLVPMVRWAVVAAYVFLMAVMNSPPYYLIGRIDLAGGSAGWHRARLIESSMERLSEWWFVGTDYTRHWMPTGVAFSPDHTDITNQYLLLGVHGGLPFMLFFIVLLAVGFWIVGRAIGVAQKGQASKHAFFCWALGATLFAQAATFISIAYVDQSFVFLFLTLAAIAGLSTAKLVGPAHRQLRVPLGRRVLLVQRAPSTLRK